MALGIAARRLSPKGSTVDQQPTVGRIVHYVSHGTPVRADGTQAYTQECRAAIITAVDTYQDSQPGQHHIGHVDLCVLNPTGMFFTQGVHHHDGAEQPGAPGCPDRPAHGNPFRYCGCGWSEAAYKGGTWHWSERT